MSDAFWTGLFGFLGFVLVAYMQLRTARQVQRVYHATNSMKDELIEATKLASHAAGMDDEKKRAKEEQL